MSTDLELAPEPTDPAGTADADAIAEAERSVIGAVLINADAIRPALEHITGADFADRRLGDLFELMTTLHIANHPIDPVTILGLAAEENIRGIDGPYLHGLMYATPTAANVDYYARKVADTAQKRAVWRFGVRNVQLAESHLSASEVMDHVRTEYDALRSRTGTTMTARTLTEVLDGTDEYDWLIPDLLERMDRLVLTGGEGAGKSTFVRQLAICAAAGIHPTTFKTIAPLNVLVVDAENTEKQWRRKARPLTVKARTTGQRNPGDHLHLACIPRMDITTEKDLGAVHRLVDEHQPDLLVIGPLYRLIPRAINNDDDASPLLAALDTLRARGLALVMEAHAGHAIGAGGERDLRPRGSAALLGWPEFGLGLGVDRAALDSLGPGEKPTVFKLVRWRGDRDEREWPDTLLRGGAWPWVDERHSSGIGPAWSPSDRYGRDD